MFTISFIFFCVSRCPIFTHMDNEILRFYADWMIQFLLTIFYLTTIITILSFYIGMCLYVKAMVDDLANQLNDENYPSNTLMSRLIGEIRFHSEILE